MSKRSQNKIKSKLFFTPIFILIVSSYLSLGWSENNETNSLTVKIVGIKDKKGVIEIGLYSTPSKFPIPGKTFKMVRPKVTSKELIYTFENIPKGDYAIATYHDENTDKKCNRNFFGIPTEAYAFSNNYRPIFSAPDFEDCSFHVDGKKSITILMIY